MKYYTLFFLLILCCSCSRYYKVQAYTARPGKALFDSLESTDRYLVLRTPVHAFAMTEISVKDSILYFTIDSLPYGHTIHITNGASRMIRDEAIAFEEDHLFREAHIFIGRPVYDEQRRRDSISFAEIERIELLGPDKKKNRNTNGVLLVTLFLAVIGAAFYGMVSLYDFR